MNKTIFLDRDGVINKKKDSYVKNIEELEILSSLNTIIEKIKKRKFLIIVITNQSAINRGFTTHQKVQEIHDKIQSNLQQVNKIDEFFYCPHRPDENCKCRKPKTELLERAAKKFNIDFKKSWFIGDSDSDIIAGEKVGCKTIKIESEECLDDAIDKIIDFDKKQEK